MGISRKDLEEKPWKDPQQLSHNQVEEELLCPLIEKLNRYQELNLGWTCSGDTLVACQRQRLEDGEELPIFFICTIRKCLQAK